MSGGGGGIIIIKSLRAVLCNPLVSGNVPSDLRPRLDAILAKNEGDVTPRDTRFMMRCQAEAYEDCN